jgi:hypothetical protein
MSKASKIIADLTELVQEHGDLECSYEDDSCCSCRVDGFEYEKDEEEFRII